MIDTGIDWDEDSSDMDNPTRPGRTDRSHCVGGRS